MAKEQKAKASTQDHLDIEDIIDDLVVLKSGWVALVMSTTAVNFDLLSEAEQDATIYAYGAFLNSLSFPLEVLVRSKKADITSYFASLEEAEQIQPNPDLKRQIGKYKEFIQTTVQQKTVLDKKFYLIINWSPLESGFGGIGSKKPTGAKNKTQILVEAKAALAPKRDHVIKQTARLGLTTRQISTQELIELFYDIYNPAPTGTQRVLLDTSSYTTPIVEPAVEVPTPAPANYGMVEAQRQNASQIANSVAMPEPVASPQSEFGASQGPVINNSEQPPDGGLRPVPPRPQMAPGQQIQPPTANPGPVANPAQMSALSGLQQATAAAAAVARPPAPPVQGAYQGVGVQREDYKR